MILRCGQVCILGLAHSRIFIVYYFRMYLALVAAGCFFGLLVLPVLLAIFGPNKPVDAAPVSHAAPTHAPTAAE